MKIPNKTSILVIVPVLVLWGCSEEPPRNTPRAESHPEEFLLQDISWIDPYAYMVDLEHPDAVQYIAHEQQYLAEQTEPWRPKLKGMMSELNAQLSIERKTTPVVTGNFEYHSEIRKGHQYPVYYRRPKVLPGDQQVVIDLNELSNGADYYALGGFSISPDEQTVAFTEDRTGDGNHTLRLRDLDSGVVTTIADGLEPNLAWNGDVVLAVEKETNSVVEHMPDGQKAILYRETDPAFSLSVRTARDRKTVVITSESHRATEIRVLSPGGELQLIAPRQEGHRYRLMIGADHMTVLSNYKRPEYAIALIQEGEVNPSDWQFFELNLPGSVVDFERFDKHLLVQVRNRLRDELVLIEPVTGYQQSILATGAGESFRLMQPDHGAAPGFQFRKRSLIQPERRYRMSVSEKVVREIDSDSAPGNYLRDQYRVEEHWLSARDGTEVPVTLVYKEGAALASRPLYLTAYGAYGVSLPIAFDPTRLPLLNRGFVLGIVHVRGGGDLGEAWHFSGRHLNKKNTFNDLVDVANRLVESGIGHPEMLAARGASAGGTVIAVVANEAPALFKVLVADVPFVDVITTLLDPTLPLTESDILEWGNPDVPADARYLFEYSPYHQVRAQAYPHLLVQASRNDGRVGTHEALKWIAKIRERTTGGALQLIDIEGHSGHLGASDQYLRRRKQALEYTFVIRGLGLGD
ncbi:MAG: S9 family peptidase [Gammaproteobacteria bacterium]|nr:S9 family peptidase [Gammaproteobacteria bacterium]MBT3867493.1 S9 family peptidase [Gammaproteobacteria bacterium]MBT4380611.1 S9 family peptidase [Gammaproteobacteria bacterium]MBT4616980.1 S9 family peptidase [Gammaproteobacteria bacterium]MBT5444509.1 S9 family peptidase [Gammaproteobacteria bacterium]